MPEHHCEHESFACPKLGGFATIEYKFLIHRYGGKMDAKHLVGLNCDSVCDCGIKDANGVLHWSQCAHDKLKGQE